jgi:signal transduction histidine kinase
MHERASLSDFIRANHEDILVEWEAFARTCFPGSKGMDRAELRDHAAPLLDWIASDLESAQTARQEEAKGKGQLDANSGHSIAAKHGELRYQDQFTLAQVVAEFRALRASVLRLWTRGQDTHDAQQVQDITRFNEAIDEAVAESILKYSDSLDEARDMFAAILGHDLRNPLGAITMGASYLQGSLPPHSPTGDTATRILSSADRMRRLINDLLDFSRVKLGGQIPIVPVEMDMEEASREIVAEMLGGHPEKVIHVERTGDVSGSWDRERVCQVVSNLLSNALEYGAPDAPVTVYLTGEIEDVMLQVHNWGPVISREDLRGIFEPLTRLSANEVELNTQRNLGLGLHIARIIVMAHRGTIEAESSEAKGTTFTARWPRSPMNKR